MKFLQSDPISTQDELIKQNLIEHINDERRWNLCCEYGNVDVNGLANPLSGSDVLANLILEGVRHWGRSLWCACRLPNPTL